MCLNYLARQALQLTSFTEKLRLRKSEQAGRADHVDLDEPSSPDDNASSTSKLSEQKEDGVSQPSWTIEQLLSFAMLIENSGELIRQNPSSATLMRMSFGALAQYEKAVDDALSTYLTGDSPCKDTWWFNNEVGHAINILFTKWREFFGMSWNAGPTQRFWAPMENYWHADVNPTKNRIMTAKSSGTVLTQDIRAGGWYVPWAQLQASFLRRYVQTPQVQHQDSDDDVMVAQFDAMDGVYRCANCMWELEHIWMLEPNE